VEWLTAAEVGSWLSVVRLISWLPWSIDQQLRRDSNLGMVEYQVMARLSQSPERTLRMSSLADLTWLSHYLPSSPACISQIRTSLGSAAVRRRSPAAVRRAASPASSAPSASRSVRPRAR
jgi:acyl carrier protein phosphodiesterase